ncbi:MAG: hypothetical protein WKF30_01830 [Pyrinomonadaceae bacterium]
MSALRAAAMVLLGGLAFCSSTAGKETRYLTGSPADVRPRLYGPAHNFGGGSTDVVPAMQWMIDQVRGCRDCGRTLDAVVLRASGANGYNALIYALAGIDSVETLVVTDRADAESDAVNETVRGAEIIFFAGGDQCNYVRFFKDTKTERSVRGVYERGGGIGGTSAGLAIQGGIVYDACSGGSAKSVEALAHPYHRDISFTYDFFNWRYLHDVITDTHFAERDRLGRLLAYLARQLAEKKRRRVLGIGVGEKTSLVIDRCGLAQVIGAGSVYFIIADHQPASCVRGAPLTYRNFKVWKKMAGENFDLQKLPQQGFQLISVESGRIDSQPIPIK